MKSDDVPVWNSSWGKSVFAYLTTGSIGSIPVVLDRRKKRYRAYSEYCVAENSIVPLTMANLGYNTYLISSNIVISKSEVKFNKTEVLEKNDLFQNEITDFYTVPNANDLIKKFLKSLKEPFFAFFIFTETHTPYMNKNNDRKTQIEAIEYLDKSFKYLYDNVPRDTRIIVTSDHSDCWHEGILYGHNPKRYSSFIRMGLLENLLNVFIVEAIKC